MDVLNVYAPSGVPDRGGPRYQFNNWRAHGQQAANLARDIARELGLSNGSAARVERAARLHDIGKSKLPNIFDEVEDQSESLSRPERELLMSHTWLGYRILQTEPNPDGWVADAALLHHEWWDGSGYPLGLAGSDIPLAARIVALADSYSMLLDQRPFASAWHTERALEDVEAKSGAQFDPECVNALVALINRREPLASRGDSRPALRPVDSH